MDVKKEEEEALATGPSDGPVVIKDEDVDDFSVDRWIKGETGEEPEVKIEEEEPVNSNSPEKGLSLDSYGSMVPHGNALNDIRRSGVQLDPKRIQTIRDVIATVTKSSTFPKETKERLKEALFAVCIEELTATEAIDKFNLVHRTFGKYMHKVRVAMGSNVLTRQLKPLLPFGKARKQTRIRECADRGLQGRADPFYVQRIQIIRDVISTFTTERKSKEGNETLEAALYAVSIGELTVVEADVKFGIPTSSLYRYVKSVREKLNSILPQLLANQPPNKLIERDEPEANIDIEPEAIELSNEEGTPFDPLDSKRIDAIHDAVRDMRKPFSFNDNVKECIETAAIHATSGPPLDPFDFKRIQTIRDALRAMRKPYYKNEDKDSIQNAIYAVCIGELTVIEASEKFNMTKRIINWWMRKAQMILGNILPPQKSSTIITIGQRTNDDDKVSNRIEATVTIDGISVPSSIITLTEWIASGRVDNSRAQPFLGTRNELREKINTILRALNFGGVLTKLVDGIMDVNVDGHTIAKACRVNRINQKSLAEYSRAVQIFIDFAKSPCASEFRFYAMLQPTLSQSTDSESGCVAPQSLPIAPEKRVMEEWEVKKEKVEYDEYAVIKEEPIEPPEKKIKEE